MRYYYILFLFTIVSIGQNAKRIPEKFSKHNFEYTDDYAWMENQNNTDLQNWISEQNEITNKVLSNYVKDNNFIFKIKDYNSLSTNSLPTKDGKFFYSNYRLFKDKPYVLHYRVNLNDMPKELVDPYRVYKNENALMLGYEPSKNSKLLAYKMSLDGSDRHEIRFVDIEKQEYLEDVLQDVKFSNMAWRNDEGIFYKRTSNKSKFTADSTYQIFYHKVGDLQTKDKLIFDVSKNGGFCNFFTKNDKLIITETNKEETFKNYYLINLSTDSTLTVVPFIKEDYNTFDFIEYKDNIVYCKTKQYPWGSVSKFNIDKPEEITTFIPQIYNHLLLNTYFFGDYVICKYKYNGGFYINIYDANGGLVRKFEAPYGMDMVIRFIDKKDNLFVTFYNHTISYANYKLNITTGETKIYFNDFIRPKPTLFSFNHFETKNITFKSRDNKNVPITIIYKKGTELNGNNPTLLKAYGGFGSISYPIYDTGLLHFLEKGGVYAFAEIRGGGDKGTNWHKNGMGMNKMNCFNDFIDAAEFLINNGYTSSNKLAITGGSHGGLVVGVALTQRPDLFKVAIPKVGVFDMLQFDKYTVGRFHLDEFGNPEIKAEFENLLSYSPLHNIKEDVNYPTTLIITGENDDRVPPVHSYKFAARLQNRIAQKNPIYLQVKNNAGHYGNVSNYQSNIEQKAEFYSFIWEELTK